MRINPIQKDIIFSQDTAHAVPMPQPDTVRNSKSINQDTIQAKTKVTFNGSLSKGSLVKDNFQEKVLVTNIKKPDFVTVNPDSQTLISSYQHVNWNNPSETKTCYVVNIRKNKKDSQILGKEKAESTFSAGKSLEIKEKTKNNQDWSFVPVFVGLLTLALVITFYRKFLIQLFERIIYHSKASKSSKDKSIPFQRLGLLLDILFIISFALLIDRASVKFGLYKSPIGFEYIIFTIIFIFLVAVSIFRRIVYKILAIVSDNKKFFNELLSNSSLYTRALGVFLLPNIFVIIYTSGLISKYLIFFSTFIVIIVLIIRILRILRVFVDGGFSIFYYILYLCALEIAPLLIVWKEVVSR